MSEALVPQQQNTALQVGGVGLGVGLFKARPMLIELVHKSSRQENVIYGQFRCVSTNEHLGTKIRVVLLAVPQPQREWFEGADFSKGSKQCFSIDGIEPHPHAANPPARYCRTCPKGDINWEKWRKTKDPKDLPPCGAYWHLLIADRTTQTPYYLNVKGTSYLTFKQAMEQQMSGILNKLFANVRAENKALGYTYVQAENCFVDTPGFVVPEGSTKKPPVPLPNIFDISFNISASSRDGGPYIMRFDDFKLMSPEDKAEFGQLYLDIVASRVQIAQPNEEEQTANMVTEIQPAPQGEVLPAEPKITI
jgi:hypothetical protein